MLKPPPCNRDTPPPPCLSTADTIFIFDVETTGLPPRNGTSDDLTTWPHLVSAAWSFYTAAGEKLRAEYFVIRPSGFTIPDAAAKIHSITSEYALTVGAPLQPVLRKLAKQIQDYQPKLAVAHNIEFDQSVIKAKFQRHNLPWPLEGIAMFCTMKRSTNLCCLPGRFGDYKWPSLSELHEFLFGEELAATHNAGADMEACAACFFDLLQRQICGVPSFAPAAQPN